ncbi:hypothetical protein SAMN05444358_11233 [Ruegeria halocynthiae]|uniref:Uncharacterized protein n=1 Tax=Ruegeria halocynthiae TaxID=985054 RepID=A0A1H3ESE4_9RHOB|nr:hypothetical protein [Ruegeria halocynthiae]SDX81477.1 hypothetical protein SAMN05444358_11233 [Ruegeria halocynthiae]
MAGQVIWSRFRFLKGKRENQTEGDKRAEFKARVARINAVQEKASREWEGYLASGALENADPLAKSYHAYVYALMEQLQKSRRHPEHDQAVKAGATIWREVQHLREEAGLPREPPRDASTEPTPSPELDAALSALDKANAETERASRLPLPEVTTEDLKSIVYEGKCLCGWVARVLPVSEFEDFVLDLWKRFGPVHPQVEDALHAFDAVRSLRRFPRLERALERRPGLPFSYDPPTQEELLRAEWKTAEPLVCDSDSIEKIEAVFAEFSADDLHEVAHGQDLYSAPFILAIARHPLCDWASALEILHSYSASAYQKYWAEGKVESDFDDKCERMLFEAFDIIAHRANGIGFRSRSFRVNFDPWQVTENGKPNPDHPQNWIKWAIPEKKLRHPKGKKHKPNIEFDSSLIRPSFEAWKKARA